MTQEKSEEHNKKKQISKLFILKLWELNYNLDLQFFYFLITNSWISEFKKLLILEFKKPWIPKFNFFNPKPYTLFLKFPNF